jgi:hypothetical protein
VGTYPEKPLTSFLKSVGALTIEPPEPPDREDFSKIKKLLRKKGCITLDRSDRNSLINSTNTLAGLQRAIEDNLLSIKGVERKLVPKHLTHAKYLGKVKLLYHRYSKSGFDNYLKSVFKISKQ